MYDTICSCMVSYTLRKEVKIHIIDDEEYERDEEFYVLLGKPQEVDVTAGSADGPDPTAVLGDCCKTTVLIREDHEFKSDVGMYIIDVIRTYLYWNRCHYPDGYTTFESGWWKLG